MNEKKLNMMRQLPEPFCSMADLIEKGYCPTCKTKIKEVEFRDALSKKEFEISGMCQKCQDKEFGK